MCNRSLIAVAGLVLAAAPLSAGAWGTQCRFSVQREASIDAAGAERVEIMARGGDLRVRPAGAARVRASGQACASHEKYLPDTQLHARRQGNVVQVVVQVPEDMKGFGMHYATLDLAVEVPAGLPVQITDTSGDATIENVNLVRLTDSSGDLLLRNVPGDVEISDSSGDIRVEHSAGLLKITDSSGDIVVHGARDVVIPSDSSGGIEIRSVSGSVRVENDSSGDIVIADVGRDVEVLADSSGDVQVSNARGQVTVPPR